MAMRRDASFLKAVRLSDILKQIVRIYNKTKKPIPVENFLDWIEFTIGLTRKKAREYLDLTLRNMHDFDYDQEQKNIIVTGEIVEA